MFSNYTSRPLHWFPISEPLPGHEHQFHSEVTSTVQYNRTGTRLLCAEGNYASSTKFQFKFLIQTTATALMRRLFVSQSKEIIRLESAAVDLLVIATNWL